ncbi:hypothetical protein IC582_015594 [Cucumis melo]
MVPAFYHSCKKMVSKWESMVFREGSCKLNVMPYFQNMASNVISRTAFGSSYEELHLGVAMKKEKRFSSFKLN